MKVEELVRKAASMNASDIHLIKGVPAKCRIDGQLVNLTDQPLGDIECESLARELAGKFFSEIETIGELDMARTIAEERVRINLFRQQGSISAALRILSNKIPGLSELGLPPVVDEFPTWQKGIIMRSSAEGRGPDTDFQLHFSSGKVQILWREDISTICHRRDSYRHCLCRSGRKVRCQL